MDYDVVLTIDAENDLDRHVCYILYVKMNPQAASSILDDYDETIETLSHSAGSLGYCLNSSLKMEGYKKIHFRKHNYFMLFRVMGNTVIIDRIFHDLEDFEQKLS